MISNDDSQQAKKPVCKFKGRPVPSTPETLNCNGCVNQANLKSTSSKSADKLPKECREALQQLIDEASKRAGKKNY